MLQLEWTHTTRKLNYLEGCRQPSKQLKAGNHKGNSSWWETISKVHQKYRAREIHFLGCLATKENRATSNVSYGKGNVLMPSKQLLFGDSYPAGQGNVPTNLGSFKKKRQGNGYFLNPRADWQSSTQVYESSMQNPNMLKHSYDYEAAYLLQFRPDYFHQLLTRNTFQIGAK